MNAIRNRAALLNPTALRVIYALVALVALALGAAAPGDAPGW